MKICSEVSISVIYDMGEGIRIKRVGCEVWLSWESILELPSHPQPYPTPLGWILHLFKSCFFKFLCSFIILNRLLVSSYGSRALLNFKSTFITLTLKNITIKSKKLGYKWLVEIMLNKTHSHYTMHATCVLRCFSRVWLWATLWTVVHQAPLSMGILQARILE